MVAGSTAYLALYLIFVASSTVLGAVGTSSEESDVDENWISPLRTNLLVPVRDRWTERPEPDRRSRLPKPVASICRNFPGLNRKQVAVCLRYPDVMAAAIHGLQTAVNECQFQLRNQRWNCSALQTKNRNPHTSAFLQKGYRETAFAYAVVSAGVAHAVSKACALGRLDSCGCAGRGRRRRGRRRDPDADAEWRWSGCSHDVDFGERFSRFLLDARQSASDIQSRIHLHNSQVGRNVVGDNMELRCKCHGMSGSCEMKTCWKALTDFRRVGTALKKRFDTAVLVDQSRIGNTATSSARGSNRNARNHLDTPNLLFYERSPNFCERRQDVGHPGVSGRRCNRTSDDLDNCRWLCCGRGYNTQRQRLVERCQCRFNWCCSVACQNCTVDRWVTVCK